MNDMMKKILIESGSMENRLALLEDGELCEYYLERQGSEKRSGNIYLGRVENVLPGMQAAFVNIGLERNAFLHVGEIAISSHELDGELEKQMEITSRKSSLRNGQEVLVQVVKEPGGDKGPRISEHITLPGRFAVLLSGVSYIGISHRISDEERRERLRKLASGHRPDGVGLIIRTAAAEASEEEIVRDIDMLSRLWQSIRLRASHAIAPSIIHQDGSLAYRCVRDLMDQDVEEVLVEGRAQFEAISQAVSSLSPPFMDRVHLHSGDTPLFSLYRIDSELEKAFDRKVWLKHGGYLVIDHAEALTVIDVNTGKFVGSRSLEDTACRTNLEAVHEIVRQIRLRDMGGIIIIDFIDMESDEHKSMLLDSLREEVKRDRTKPHVVDITSLGLVELTRKKTRQPLHVLTRKACPRCHGSGSVPTEQTIAFKLLRELRLRAACTRAKAWLITAAAPVAGELMLCGVPRDMKAYVCPERGHFPEEYRIDALSDDKVPEGARQIPNEA